MYLRNSYDALNWELCLNILVTYDIGPHMELIICRYWDVLTIVALVGRYYGSPFKGSIGSTQFDPLSPTIFNMVVDAVIPHWETVVVVEEAYLEGFGRAVQTLAALFYVGYRLLASLQPARL